MLYQKVHFFCSKENWSSSKTREYFIMFLYPWRQISPFSPMCLIYKITFFKTWKNLSSFLLNEKMVHEVIHFDILIERRVFKNTRKIPNSVSRFEWNFHSKEFRVSMESFTSKPSQSPHPQFNSSKPIQPPSPSRPIRFTDNYSNWAQSSEAASVTPKLEQIEELPSFHSTLRTFRRGSFNLAR